MLFIVEGQKTEVTIFKQINRVFDVNNYDIIPYQTSIYELYQDMISEPDLDLLLVLKEKQTDKTKRETLSKEYISIYLIFDFDPQYQKFSEEKLIHMLEYFNDSTQNGQLLINYPMVESMRHLKTMPDYDFFDRTISNCDCTSQTYKQLVHQESQYTQMNKYTKEIIMDMMLHHLAKVNYLITHIKGVFEYKGSVELFHQLLVIARIQIQNLTDGFISVLNTSMFFILDLNFKLLQSSIAKKNIFIT